MRQDQSRVSSPYNRQPSSCIDSHHHERKEKITEERRQKFHRTDNNVEYFISGGRDDVTPVSVNPLSSKTSKRGRSKYRRQRPMLNVSGEADLLSDLDCDSDYEESPFYCAPSSSEQHLLSDHTAIDVLLLEAEMRTVLSDLEAFGTTDDDYGSLALTSEEEKVESDNWPTTALLPSSLSYRSDAHCIEESSLIVNEEGKEEEGGGGEDYDENDDWEILSDEGSWSVETFQGAKNIRNVVLPRDSPISTTLTTDNESTLPEKRAVDGPAASENKGGSGARICIELLENADIWTSIRDTIRSLGGSKQNLLFRR
jgi:hypothetical protein